VLVVLLQNIFIFLFFNKFKIKQIQKKRVRFLVDNYDSFTYNLYDYLAQLGAQCTVIRNDEYTLDAIQAMTFDGLVLSPGPKTPKDAGLLMQLIHTFHRSTPLMGICLGHQGICEYFGGTLTKASLPMHGKTSMLTHTRHVLFENTPSPYEVMRYHSLIIKNIENTDLEVISTTSEGEIMAIAHRELPVFGVQFHPESILTQNGLQLLNNWLTIVRKTIV